MPQSHNGRDLSVVAHKIYIFYARHCVAPILLPSGPEDNDGCFCHVLQIMEGVFAGFMMQGSQSARASAVRDNPNPGDASNSEPRLQFPRLTFTAAEIREIVQRMRILEQIDGFVSYLAESTC